MTKQEKIAQVRAVFKQQSFDLRRSGMIKDAYQGILNRLDFDDPSDAAYNALQDMIELLRDLQEAFNALDEGEIDG